jgi:hypothetical protein
MSTNHSPSLCRLTTRTIYADQPLAQVMPTAPLFAITYLGHPLSKRPDKFKIYVMGTVHVTIITCNSQAQLQDISIHGNVDQHYATKLFKSATNYSSFREV